MHASSQSLRKQVNNVKRMSAEAKRKNVVVDAYISALLMMNGQSMDKHICDDYRWG